MRARSRLRGSAVPSNGDPAQSSPKPVSGPRDEAGLAMIQHPGSWAPQLLPVADHPGTGSVTGHKGVYWYKSSEVSPEGCRVDSGHMLCCRGSNLRTDDHPARTQCERNHRRSIGKMLLTITNPLGASARE